MNYSFSKVPQANIPRSSFDRTFLRTMTFNAGNLYPCYFDEVLPGDSVDCKCSLFARMPSALVVPSMDVVTFDVHFFFVPARLVWNHFQNFMGEELSPGEFVDYSTPALYSATDTVVESGSIFDYFGIGLGTPFTADANLFISALPFRAYNLIWNEWFRDENLQRRVTINYGDANDPVSDFKLLPRGKRHGYFTSALPFPQKGPNVALPLATTAPVVGNGMTLGLQGYEDSTFGLVYNPNDSIGNAPMVSALGTDSGTLGGFTGSPTGLIQSLGVINDPEKSGLVTYLDESTSVTINKLRQAVALQHFYEMDARGGSRYTEILRSHFGVVSPDARLQRPEYLGGFSFPLQTNPVPQTSSTDATSPQADLASYVTGRFSGDGFTKSFVEHGFLIGLISARANLTYFQGLPRAFTRQTRTSYYFPAFAHLGEQAVLNKEIYSKSDDPEGVFGYQEAWAELRYKENELCGLARPDAPLSIGYFTYAQEFGETPKLNEDFIVEQPDLNRAKAVTSAPDFLCQIYFNQRWARAMPVYSVPGLNRL